MGQKLNEVKVSLDFVNETPTEIFEILEEKTDFRFGYGRDVARIKKQISGTFQDVSLESVLVFIAQEAQLQFKRINNNISVLKADSGEDNQQRTYIEEEDRTISGVVKDQTTGDPLVGATVRVTGTQIGTVTDADGGFTMSVPDDARVLTVSYIGYLSLDVSMGNRTSLDIVLQQDSEALEEVIVVGYGTQKRSDYTGSVSSVPEQRLEQVPNLNVAQAIQGAIPGVNITTNQAGAASEESIIIRGRNSILANNSPLIVVDRIPYNGQLRDINVSDIESIQVLKDASATAIYGSRGANGVILITTKEGRIGKPQVTYDGRYAVQRFDRLPNYMNAQEFLDFKELREPGNVTATEQENFDNGNFTDWQDLGIRDGQSWQHNLSVSGTAGAVSYYFGGSYLDVKGVAINDDYRRALGRVNLDIQVTDWLTVGSRTQYSDDDRSGLSPDFSDLGRKNPLINPFEDNGELTIFPWPEFTDIGNPLEPINYENTDESRQLITNNYVLADVPFVKGLTYRLNTGITERFEEFTTYRGRNTQDGLTDGGAAQVETSRFTSTVIENILDFNRTFDKHLVGVTALYSYQRDKSTSDILEAQGFPNDITTFYNPAQASVVLPSFEFVRTDLISSMLRLNYGYNEKYFITLTGRRDGYSGFGDDNKWGDFGTVAGAWIVSQENFFPASDTFNFLKLRASYGENGNQAVDPYLSIAKFSEQNFVDGGTSLPGVVPENLANTALSWETSSSFNVGMDFGLLGNTVSGSLNYFNTNTTDLLLNRTISPVQGIGSITDNVGETKNSGFELVLTTTQEIAGAVTWNANFNFTSISNEIVSLGLGENGEVDDVASGLFIGESITSNFDFIFDGVWQQNEADQAANFGSQPGYIKLRDVDGNGEITADDRTIIGQTDPTELWGFTNTFTYKNFSLSVFMHGVHGVAKANQLFQDASSSSGVRRNVIRKNWWTPENPTNDFYANELDARLQQGFTALPYQDASFIRLKDVTLSYNLPDNLLEKIGLGRVTFYFSGRNLATLTDWEETDPELDAGRGTIPLQKEYVFGITLTH
ncbi:MAG: TonB-dependent receptor, partial [Bacteroidota bacterium]